MMVIDALIGLGVVVVGALCWGAGYSVGKLVGIQQAKKGNNV